MKPLTDLDPMPFGAHAGKPMQEVPASYLHWAWTNRAGGKYAEQVREYVEKNLLALKQEYPDGIWR